MTQSVKERNVFFTSSVLIGLCCILSICLALINSLTKPVIDKRKADNELRAVKEVSEGYELIGDIQSADDEFVKSYYLIRSPSSSGYVVNIESSGYGGVLKMTAGFTKEGKLLSCKMVENSETPGLGKKSEERWYMKIFEKGDQLPSSKNDLTVEDRALISGASVTFSGVSKGLIGAQSWVRGRKGE